MGHFLLTNSLLPMMRDGRVVNIASTYHFQADGSTLQPVSASELDSEERGDSEDDSSSRALLAMTAPSAARHENTTFRHRRIAYGVSKLAQVLHAKELQRRLDADSFATAVSSVNDTITTENNVTAVETGPRNVKIVSVCPGWVGTNILPPGPAGNFIRNNAFSTRASILAPMCAMLDSSLQGGEFVVNYQIPLTQHSYWSPLMFRVVTFLGVRDMFTDILAVVALLQQSKTYGCHVQQSSAESNDEHLARSLYDWTLNELTVKGY
jgi:NAD(P)-dependent dehydrogenase (short-subunit alcohol dehydrogenase family)